MGKAFKIVENDKEDINIEKIYPNLPFVVKDEYEDLFLVFYDENYDKYRYLDLENGAADYNGYTSLDDMFNNNDLDVILETELIIKGKYK